MGLDMYLSEVKYISHHPGLAERNEHYRDELRLAQNVLDMTGLHITDQGGSVVVKSTVMYWRKANAIHDWFVQNCQDGEDDCQEVEVSIEQLTELRDLAKRVMTKRGLAPELLPTTSGLFFGDTNYDKWYFEDLAYTVAELDVILARKSEDTWFEYRSSW